VSGPPTTRRSAGRNRPPWGGRIGAADIPGTALCDRTKGDGRRPAPRIRPAAPGRVARLLLASCAQRTFLAAGGGDARLTPRAAGTAPRCWRDRPAMRRPRGETRRAAWPRPSRGRAVDRSVRCDPRQYRRGPERRRTRRSGPRHGILGSLRGRPRRLRGRHFVRHLGSRPDRGGDAEGIRHHRSAVLEIWRQPRLGPGVLFGHLGARHHPEFHSRVAEPPTERRLERHEGRLPARRQPGLDAGSDVPAARIPGCVRGATPRPAPSARSGTPRRSRGRGSSPRGSCRGTAGGSSRRSRTVRLGRSRW